MTIEYNTANHICNVVRRNIHGCFPDLQIAFIVHAEHEREKAYQKEIKLLNDHPAMESMDDYLHSVEAEDILKKNRSCFTVIARYNTPGFLNKFKNNAYLAVCFVNHDRFDSEQYLRNHAYHLAWLAIALYRNFTQDQMKSKKQNIELLYSDHKNILTPVLSREHFYHRNLKADIFAVCAQILQGRPDALESMCLQRINSTLSAESGYIAENFPFPICMDTLGFVLEDNINYYKKSKKIIPAAITITDEVGRTYENTSVEQWHNFSNPAQQMAWAGHKPNVILGTAIYTSEDAYVQSIADMLAEHSNTAPQVITTLQEQNPFVPSEENARVHQKKCLERIEKPIKSIASIESLPEILSLAKQQNYRLLDNQPLGWCAHALIEVVNIFKDSTDIVFSTESLNQTYDKVKRQIETPSWDTLSHFSQLIFEAKRSGHHVTIDTIINLSGQSDEFISIHYALSTLPQIEQALNQAIAAHKSSKDPKNIIDFISPNAIKQK